MKKLSLLFIGTLIGSTFLLTSCGDDDESTPPTPPDSGNTVVTENISGEITWTSDKVYELGGRITVLDGATLTIEAGTIIKGQAGTQANATALLVARGGKLNANGTASAPIIFTSVADEITPDDVAAGNFESPNLDPDINGLWGGVIILGKAAISASAAEVQIEGIPTSDTNGLYGGSDDSDNSGTIRYISIRHGGTNIGAGNEINGLSLGGVGSGTTIEHVEIVANQDDGIEWFGGTVNVSNALVWNVGDDGMDTDQSWSGTCSNFMVVTAAGHNFELDGPEGSTLLDVQHTFENGTVVHAILETDDGSIETVRSAEDIINTDDNSGVVLRNIYITALLDGNETTIPVGNQVDESTFVNVDFEGVVLNVPTTDLVDFMESGAIPTGITAGTSGTKADASVFAWTWAGQSGNLAGL
ncbi:hypothetical protein HZR84_09015 [Hyphobacterium sp. CCMP332]|nr:hypothetical protein HZR84_09015 [Hyphobacterium sp. CCMP332]